jgi:V8-like Glu-specific endopeptidase
MIVFTRLTISALVAVWSCLPLCAEQTPLQQEVVIGPDSRVRITPTTSAPYSSICRLSVSFPSGAEGFGSGVIIGNHWVITAGHVLYDPFEGGYANVVVQPAYDAGATPFGSHAAVNTFVHPNYEASGDNDFDFGLIELSYSAGLNAGRLMPVNHPDFYFDGTPNLEVVGYPGDLTLNCTQMFTANDATLSYDDFILQYSTDTFGGESGGAVLDSFGNLVAVHSGGLNTGEPATSYNQGCRVNQGMFSWIKSQIDDSYDNATGNNETYSTATDLSATPGVSLQSLGGLAKQWDEDWYKIEVAPGNFRIHAECTFTNGSGNIDIEMRDSAGGPFTPTAGNSVSATNANLETLDCIVPASGTYYIRVFGENMENTYDLVWQPVAMPSVLLTPRAGGIQIVEAGQTDTYKVKLSQKPTASVTVTISPDSQETTSPTSLTFTTSNWNTLQTVTVTAVDDALLEGLHTGTITHTTASADGFFNLGDSWTITASIVDNDSPGVLLTPSGGSTVVKEGGATDSYTVVLIMAPTDDVTITATAGADSTVSPASRVFTSANWNIPQTFSVRAINDLLINGTRTNTITHSASSADAGYNGLTIGTITVTVKDNDGAAAAAGGGKKGGCEMSALGSDSAGGMIVTLGILGCLALLTIAGARGHRRNDAPMG